MTGEVSDPGNVSALSYEVEGAIEEAFYGLASAWDTGGDGAFLSARLSKPILRDLVRKALATVEAERDGWKEQSASFCNAEVAALTTLQAAREQARALAEALRRVEALTDLEMADGDGARDIARAALASWDTSQKESRGEQSEGRGEGR